MRTTAFTLFELMVTITIIALLVALLLPVIGMMRDVSQRTVCAGQLRQIGVAQEAWRADHRGEFLNGDPYMGGYGGYYVWPSCVSGNALFDLKEDQGVPYRTWFEKDSRWQLEWVGFGNALVPEATARSLPYGGRIHINYQYRAALPNCPHPWVIRRNNLINPSGTMLAGDFAARPGTSGLSAEGLFNHRYGGLKANMLFVDGHVKNFRDADMAIYFTNWVDFLTPAEDG